FVCLPGWLPGRVPGNTANGKNLYRSQFCGLAVIPTVARLFLRCETIRTPSEGGIDRCLRSSSMPLCSSQSASSSTPSPKAPTTNGRLQMAKKSKKNDVAELDVDVTPVEATELMGASAPEADPMEIDLREQPLPDVATALANMQERLLADLDAIIR